MKGKFIILACVAVLMSACGGGSNQSASSCPHNQEGHNHGNDKAACCTEAGKVDPKKIIGAKVFIKPEKVDAFLAATKSLVEKSRAEEGCVSYTLYQDPQDKTIFFVFEEWKNQAAVDFHFGTEHFKQFGKDLEECASAPAVITIYDSVAEKKV